VPRGELQVPHLTTVVDAPAAQSSGRMLSDPQCPQMTANAGIRSDFRPSGVKRIGYSPVNTDSLQCLLHGLQRLTWTQASGASTPAAC